MRHVLLLLRIGVRVSPPRWLLQAPPLSSGLQQGFGWLLARWHCGCYCPPCAPVLPRITPKAPPPCCGHRLSQLKSFSLHFTLRSCPCALGGPHPFKFSKGFHRCEFKAVRCDAAWVDRALAGKRESVFCYWTFTHPPISSPPLWVWGLLGLSTAQRHLWAIAGKRNP